MSEKRHCDYQACEESEQVADTRFFVLARRDTDKHHFCSLACLIAWASAEIRGWEMYWEDARIQRRRYEQEAADAVRRSDELPIGSAREKER